jgi:type II secretion system protein H
MNNKRILKAAGFTMIEMMVAIAIIGIMAAMAGPSFSSWIPKMKLKAEAREKLNYLRQARSRAISENSQFGIYFDLGNSDIVFFKDIINPQLSIYEVGADSIIGTPIDCASNVIFTNSTLTNNTVIFYPNGSASTSGQIELDDTESSYKHTISVLASTGRVRLE